MSTGAALRVWMCDPEQYMVIDHVEQLPRELPKIYRRVVH